MPLVNIKDMLNHATHNGYTLGGFHVFNLESLTAVIRAAELCRAPAILSLYQPMTTSMDLETLAVAAEHAASHANTPVGLHFDHAINVESAVAAIRMGCNGIGIDSAQRILPDKIELTRAVVDIAHGCGVPVEGLLGCLAPDRSNDPHPVAGHVELTSVDEAKAFADRTGIDFLAASLAPNGHATGRCKPDMQRLARIKTAVPLPFVVHGGSHLAEDQIRRLVALGVAKINFSPLLPAGTVHKDVETDGQSSYMRNKIADFAQERMRILGSAGRAAEVLLQCNPCKPIEHVIIFNVAATTNVNVEAVLAEGRRVLATIPGVRQVNTGHAVKSNASYRFCWLIRFVHPAVIDSYREHPLHKKFADEIFRPIAPERISIDFEMETALPAPYPN